MYLLIVPHRNDKTVIKQLKDAIKAIENHDDVVKLFKTEAELFRDPLYTPKSIVDTFSMAMRGLLIRVFTVETSKYSLADKWFFLVTACELGGCYQYQHIPGSSPLQSGRSELIKKIYDLMRTEVGKLSDETLLAVHRGNFELMNAVKLVFETSKLDSVLAEYSKNTNGSPTTQPASNT